MIPKPGKSPSDVDSYRPISLLPSLGKIMEMLILNRLFTLENVTSAIPEFQFGFRLQHGTPEQLHRVVNFALEAFEKKEYAVAAFLDIQQAFDRVWHPGLLYKAKSVLTPQLFQLVKSFLEERTFHVSADGYKSSTKPISAGVPQGEMLHIDIFSTDTKYFLTCIDKFSKFAVVQPVPSRTIEDLKPADLMNIFPKAKVIYCDNEPSLNLHSIVAMLENHFGVIISNALPLHSVSKVQVERFHSTLVELARCLKIEKRINDTVELILLATARYKKSIHSVIVKRPADVVQTQSNDPECDIQDKIKHAQDNPRNIDNASRQNRVFEVGEKVLVKSNRRLGNKLSPLSEEKTVDADMGTTALI
ncbi:hypothetical protein KR074_002912 [Drosophila pseudoananassae]|nr:hypothetical protein KR074_002912 [Drosophila pseudoananassae]